VTKFLHGSPEKGTSRALSLRGDWRARVLSSTSAVLAGEHGQVVLSGEEQVELLRLLDGTRTERKVLEELATTAGETGAEILLDQFAAWGLVRAPGMSGGLDAVDEFCLKLGDGPRPADALRSASVHLQALQDRVSADWIAETLGRAGIGVVRDGGGDEADLRIVVSSDGSDPRLDDIQREQIRRKKPWMAVSSRGTRMGFAPLFHPSPEPCWACVSFWLRVNRPVEEFVRRGGADFAAPEGKPVEPGFRVLAEHVALSVGRFLTGRSEAPFEFVAVDARTLDCARHPVRRRPQCPVCGNPRWMEEQGARPIVLEATEAGYRKEGGFRRLSPEDAYGRFKHLVSPVCGPVSQLGPMPRRHSETRPVFVSGYRVCPHGSRIDANSFQRVCAGKGRSVSQARASALFEAVERFSGVYQGDEAILRGSLDALGSEALHPHDLQLFSERQYRTWTPAETERNGALRIARPCSRDTVLDWTPGWSISRNERRHVPFAYCYSDTPSGIDRSHVSFTGNGVASGTSLEEAILQGLFELVERDAVAVWWYNRIGRPGVAASLLDDPWVHGLVREYRELGWDLWVLDLTHDLSIPVHAALARSAVDGRFSIGFGCHLDPALALQRALTEVNQVFDPRGELRAPWDASGMDSDTYLLPQGEGGLPVSAFAGTRLEEAVGHCVELLRRAGLEVVVVDKSRPDTGISVAQVVVPGLRHFWPRFRSGRLYSVPVTMGWLDAPLPEESLNPVPLVL